MMEPPRIPVRGRRAGAVLSFQRQRALPIPLANGAERQRPLLALEAGDLRQGGPDIFRRDTADGRHGVIRAALDFLLEPLEAAPATRDQIFAGRCVVLHLRTRTARMKILTRRKKGGRSRL